MSGKPTRRAALTGALTGALTIAATAALTPARSFAVTSGTGAAPAVPPVNPAALRAAIAGLPDAEASGALVRVTGSAGSFSGVLQLAAGSRIGLDDSVQRHLPGLLPADHPAITVRRLPLRPAPARTAPAASAAPA
jgi:D-alanyl-D-alanine carboxypeptidase